MQESTVLNYTDVKPFLASQNDSNKVIDGGYFATLIHKVLIHLSEHLSDEEFHFFLTNQIQSFAFRLEHLQQSLVNPLYCLFLYPLPFWNAKKPQGLSNDSPPN